MENNLASLLRDFAQATSNSVASNAAVPVDVLAWLLRKGGVNVPSNPVMGSDWLAEKGFTREVKNKGAGLAGDIAGMVLPFAGVTKAPQIAKGLLGMGENLATPNAMKNASQRGAIVWHGSPHKFDAFDSSKIGTGEGAQAYGHGLYLADSPTVANSYIPANETGKAVIAKQLQSEIKRAARYSNEGGQEVFEMFNKGYTPQAIRNNIDNILADGNVHPAYAKKMNQAYEKGMQIYQQNPAGSLYKVDLPDEHIAKMLDWDKPLSQQTPEIQKFIESIKNTSLADPHLTHKTVGGQLWDDAKGSDIMGILKQTNADTYFGPKYGVETSNMLRDAGIPGIKYLDGGSRTAGQGSSNYVVFPGNERLLKILERNGQKP